MAPGAPPRAELATNAPAAVPEPRLLRPVMQRRVRHSHSHIWQTPGWSRALLSLRRPRHARAPGCSARTAGTPSASLGEAAPARSQVCTRVPITLLYLHRPCPGHLLQARAEPMSRQTPTLPAQELASGLAQDVLQAGLGFLSLPAPFLFKNRVPSPSLANEKTQRSSRCR